MARRHLMSWARILLAGSLAIIIISVATGHWLFAVVTSLARQVREQDSAINSWLGLLGQFSFTKGRPVWVFAALLTVPLVSAITIVVQLCMGRQVSSGNILARLALGIIWPRFASVGEEFGWRAFMLPRLQSRFKALTAALIVGLAWGIWHLSADFNGLLLRLAFHPLFHPGRTALADCPCCHYDLDL